MNTSTGQPSPDHQAPHPAKNTVNDGLTPKRPQPVTENSEYATFARRILRAYSRHIATGDIESLTYLITLADDINEPPSTPSTDSAPGATPGLTSEIGSESRVKPHNSAGGRTR